MKIGKCTIAFDFWLPWLFGLGGGWGWNWLDIGPFTIYWPLDISEKE